MSAFPAALAPYVSVLSAYDIGPLGGVHRGLPSSTVSITIPEAEHLEIGWSARPRSRQGSGERQRFRAAVAGLHLDAAEIPQEGHMRGVWLTLSPLGVRALLGMPASELAGQVADLADVVPGMAELPERLASCRSWRQRRALVERALLTGLARHGDQRPELGAALDALAGAERVQDAARLLGCSRRHLSGTVRAELGVTAKEFQRLVRFEDSRRRMASSGPVRLAEVAAASGFADQAHLAREWRAMAGCTPTEWLHAEVR